MDQQNQAGKCLQILLADDCADSRFLIKHFFRTSSHHLHIVDGGAEALAAFTSQVFDLVLLDIEMPEVDGYQVAAAIKSYEISQARAPTPLIALTGHALEQDIAKIMAAGFDRYLGKPVRQADLLKLVGDLT